MDTWAKVGVKPYLCVSVMKAIRFVDLRFSSCAY